MKALKKILLILIIVIIVAGIVMISIKGFNYSLKYSKTQRMNIYIDKDYNIETVKEIAKEVLGEKTKVDFGTQFNTVVSILNNEISEESQNTIIEKLQEKLELEIDKEKDVIIMEIPQISFYDIIGKYILPLIITTGIFIIFTSVKYRNKGIINTIFCPIISLILSLFLYTSIYALARIPVNELFSIIAILIYLMVLLYNIIKLNKD